MTQQDIDDFRDLAIEVRSLLEQLGFDLALSPTLARSPSGLPTEPSGLPGGRTTETSSTKS